MIYKNTHRQFYRFIAVFVVLFRYVSIIFNKLLRFVAVRIYKLINFVNIPMLLSFQQQVVFSVSQYLKTRISPYYYGLLCLLINPFIL